MTRALGMFLLLAGCATQPGPIAHSEPPFRACLALPPPLPKLRTIEAVTARAEIVERVAVDCAFRLHAVVEAWPR